MRTSSKVRLLTLALVVMTSFAVGAPLLYPDTTEFTQEDAQKMIASAQDGLAPVYGPLAEQIVTDFGLAEKEGIGIDLGSGPGTLLIELCKRTRMHWVNADINTYFFAPFFEAAAKAGLGHRVSAVFADAQALPFRNDYAEVVVSRGSFQFWEDKQLAFSEIYRVLKPGGVAFVGRGLSRNLPVSVARSIRDRQKEGGKSGPPPYDIAETERELTAIMQSLDIERYTIHKPCPPDSDGITYGIWLEIRK